MRGNLTVDAPLRFESFLRPLVWGGRRLGDVLGKPLVSEASYGESWELSDHPMHHSVVATGGARGRSLRHLMEQDLPALLGAGGEVHRRFPWLVKFLDACDWLSVQVHPDEEAVRRWLPGENSKTESWFILDASPGSRIYAGLVPGTDEARLRAALRAGTVVECLHRFEPRPGDCVFLPAGTVHAIGGGVLFAEVQQTSDATFRLYDWNRGVGQGTPRPLHIEEAMASIAWDRGPVEPVHVAHFSDPVETAHRQLLVRCPYFVLEYVQSREPFACGGEGRPQALIVLRGGGRWEPPAGEETVAVGQVWLLPASLPRTWLRPEPALAALLCTLP